jgi:hypothetical protein
MNRSMTLVFVCALALPAASAALRAQEDEKDDLVVVKAGRIITVSGEDIKDGTIVIRNGKIEAVGQAVDYPYGGKVIDARDQVVMPGLVNPFSRYSALQGGGAPNTKFGDQFFEEPERFKDILAAGYTTLGLVPAGRGMPGRFLVVRTFAQDSQGLVLSDEGPVFMSFNSPSNEKPQTLQAFKAAQAEIDKIAKAKKEWEEKKKAADEAKKKAQQAPPAPSPAPAPAPQPGPTPQPTPPPVPTPTPTPVPTPVPNPVPQPIPTPQPAPPPGPQPPAVPETFTPPPINPAAQPLVDLLQKKAGAIAVVEIGLDPYSMWGGTTLMSGGIYLHWQEVTKEHEFPHAFHVHNSLVETDNPFVVFPETDADQVTSEMGKQKLIVAIYPNINHHPFTKDKYSLGLKLAAAGCRVVYVPEREQATDYANMFASLARMVRGGFPRQDILKTVTLHAAEMLGLGQRLGSIQAGRDANLVFLSGDPLSYETRVKRVMIEGKVIDAKPRVQ